jgi:hypothetical protein
MSNKHTPKVSGAITNSKKLIAPRPPHKKINENPNPKLVMESSQTPIEQWIEEHFDKIHLNFLIDFNSYKRGCKELLTYLGLQDQPDPKGWIIEAKHRFNTSEGLGYRNQHLESEIERLKEALTKIYTCDVKIENYMGDYAIVVRLREIADKALKGE